MEEKMVLLCRALGRTVNFMCKRMNDCRGLILFVMFISGQHYGSRSFWLGFTLLLHCCHDVVYRSSIPVLLSIVYRACASIWMFQFLFTFCCCFSWDPPYGLSILKLAVPINGNGSTIMKYLILILCWRNQWNNTKPI